MSALADEKALNAELLSYIKTLERIDLTKDDDISAPKQRKMTDFLKQVPFT